MKATASHQTVVVDGHNSAPAEPGRLLGFVGSGRDRFVDMVVPLAGGATLRRAVTLLRKDDGLPILIDMFDVEGGRIHDYNVRVGAPPGSLTLLGPELRPRKTALYQEHSTYPLLDFQTGGKVDGGWAATWGRGKEKVRATVLTPCTELITYRSPGWRTQVEITADPKKHFDTLVLRSRKKASRFVVVYEILSGAPGVRSTSLEDADDTVTVRLSLSEKRTVEIRTPGVIQEGSEVGWEVRKGSPI